MANLTIDINGVCNEACKFCYQDLDGSVLPERDILNLVKNQPDKRTIEIGGGEPFLDPRIVGLTKSIRKMGRSVHISTNATLVPRGFLDLEDSVREGVQVQVSIHGSNPERYYRVHGRDLFDKVVDNAKKIKQRFSTLMTSAIYQENFDDVPNLVALSEELGLPLRVNLVFPVGKGKHVQRLSPGQVDSLRGYLLGQRLSKGDKIDSPLIHSNNCYAIANAYGVPREGLCPLDCGKVYVSPRGSVRGCEFHNLPTQTKSKEVIKN